jgi:hypothetical protein
MARLLFLPSVVFHLIWYFLFSGQATNVPFHLACVWSAIPLIIVLGSVGPGLESLQVLAGSGGEAPWNKKKGGKLAE